MRQITWHRVAVAVLGAATACSSADSGHMIGPPGFQIARVIVSPNSVGFSPGTNLQMTALVQGSGDVLQAVRWSLTPADGPVSISPDGIVSACYPGGDATVTATSVQDTAVSGTADVIAAVAGTGLPSVSDVTVDGSTTPARLDSLTGSVDVIVSLAAAQVVCYLPSEVRLVIRGTSGDTVVAVQPAAPTATTQRFTLPFHSADQVGGRPAFPDGAYTLRADAQFAGYPATFSSSTFAVTISN